MLCDYAIPCLSVSLQLGDEHDQALPDPSLWRVVKASAPEWYLIFIGVLASAADGATFPTMAIFMGRVLEVCGLHVSVCSVCVCVRVRVCVLWYSVSKAAAVIHNYV